MKKAITSILMSLLVIFIPEEIDTTNLQNDLEAVEYIASEDVISKVNELESYDIDSEVVNSIKDYDSIINGLQEQIDIIDKFMDSTESSEVPEQEESIEAYQDEEFYWEIKELPK